MRVPLHVASLFASLLAVLLAMSCSEPAAQPELPVRHELVLRLTEDVGRRDAVVAIADARLRDAGLGRASADPEDAMRVVCGLTTAVPADVSAARELVVRPGTLIFRICVQGDVAAAERARRRSAGADYAPRDPCYEWLSNAHPGDEDVLVRAEELPLLVAAADGEDDDARRRALAAALVEFVFTQDDIDKVELKESPVVGARGPAVFFGLRSDRRAAFERFTAANVKRQIAIVIDGRVDSTPVILSPLPGSGILEGGGAGFSEQEARSLVAALRSRPLPSRVEIVEERTPK